MSTVRLLRAAVAVCAGAVVAVLTASGAEAAPAASPWAQAGYNAAASNANTAETALTPGAVARAGLLRTLPGTGRGCPAFLSTLGSPLLVDQRVYAVGGRTVTARSAGTGQELWRTALPDFNGYRTVALSHGLVFVSGNDCGTTDPVGVVYALNAADGSIAYSVGSPVGDAITDVSVSGDYLVVRSTEVGGEVDLTVFRAVDGSQVWTLSGTTGDSGLQAATARVVDGKVFTQELNSFGFPVQQARDLATGEIVWTDKTPVAIERGDDDVSGTHLYATSDAGYVEDIDPATGDFRFGLGSATHTLAVDGQRVYATCATDSTIVCAFDRATGRREWVRGVDRPVTSAITAAGVLYLSSGLVLSTGTGRKIRTLPATPAAVGDGRVAVQRGSGAIRLYGLPGN